MVGSEIYIDDKVQIFKTSFRLRALSGKLYLPEYESKDFLVRYQKGVNPGFKLSDFKETTIPAYHKAGEFPIEFNEHGEIRGLVQVTYTLRNYFINLLEQRFKTMMPRFIYNPLMSWSLDNISVEGDIVRVHYPINYEVKVYHDPPIELSKPPVTQPPVLDLRFGFIPPEVLPPPELGHDQLN